MSSVPPDRSAGGGPTDAASPLEADRAFQLALAAWADRCQRPGESRQPDDVAYELATHVPERLAHFLGESLDRAIDPALPMVFSGDRASALDQLRTMHHATARVDLTRVHASWCVRALREESPAVQRMVVASLPESLRHPLQSGLMLDSRDLVSERAPASAFAACVMSLWTERLVGGEAERADDPPAVIMLGRLSPRAGYRLCRQIGICKFILAGQDQGGRAPTAAVSHQEWLESALAAADESVRLRARRDVESSQVSRLPQRQRAARIGLTTVARLLATAEPFRLRWALQHWPYPIAKLVRSLMTSATPRAPSLLKGETLVLKTAWERLNLDGRLALTWPESPQSLRGGR